MESDLGIPTALFAAPVREIVALGKSQIGFINIFALPLFQGVADVMPAMMFSVEQLLDNRANWEAKIKVEQRRLKGGGQVDRKDSDDSIAREGTFSPRNVSVTNSKTDSRQHRPPTASSQSEPVKKRPSVQEEVMKLAQGPRNNSTASEFDNPPPEPENEAQPYRSHTIPVGDPKMEALEQLAIVPTNTVLGQMQRVYNSVSTGLLEYPRPISSTSHDRATLQPATATSRLAERDVEPVTVITSSKICDGIEIPSDPSTMPLSNDWASSGTDGTNGTTATNGTASRAAGSTRGTSVESSDEPKRSPRKTARIPSASAPDFPSAHDKTSSVVADAHAVSAFSEAEPRAPGQGILASMRSVTRKPSKGRFRFWRKKSDKHALDGIPPVPPISVPSTPQSATP
jgi:3',5'-cyclic-nucleotide phosphodiesterase